MKNEPEKQNNYFDDYFDENTTTHLKSDLNNRKYHQTKIDNITKEYQRKSRVEKRITELLRK